jgi:hypothetical protein
VEPGLRLAIFFQKQCCGQACTAIIPALRRLRKKYPKFKASLGSIVQPCLKKQVNEQTKEAFLYPLFYAKEWKTFKNKVNTSRRCSL